MPFSGSDLILSLENGSFQHQILPPTHEASGNYRYFLIGTLLLSDNDDTIRGIMNDFIAFNYNYYEKYNEKELVFLDSIGQ
jgi:hypothetical protein